MSEHENIAVGSAFHIKGKEHSYIVRPTELADIENINTAYNAFTQRSRTVEQWKWQWFELPDAPAFSWLIIDEDTKEIVGHHGIMPIMFANEGNLRLVGKTENTFVKKGRQKDVPYLRIEMRLLRLAKEKFDFIYTTASRAGREGAVKKMRNYLGYMDSGASRAFGLSFNAKVGRFLVAKKLKQRWLGAFGTFVPLAIWVSTLPARHKASKCQANSIGWSNLSEAARLWEQHKNHYGLTPDRTEDWLEWRFANNPAVPYTLWKIEKANTCFGFAVTRKQTISFGERKIETILIEDIFVANGSVANFTNAIAALIRALPAPQMLTLTTLGQADALNKAAKIYLGPLGRVLQIPGPEFLVYLGDNQAPQWYFTNCFSEGGAHEIASPI